MNPKTFLQTKFKKTHTQKMEIKIPQQS